MTRNIVFIGGINGSGKTTIAQKLSEKTGIPFFEGSATLLKKLNLGPDDHATLRALPQEVKKLATLEMFREINANNEVAIVTSHFIMVANKFLPADLEDRYNLCSCLIHLKTDPQEILMRIEKSDRKRGYLFQENMSDPEKLDFLAEAQDKSIHYARKISKEYKIPLFVIDNNFIDQAVEEILKVHHYFPIRRIM